MFDFTKNECGKLIGTEQQQILQLYEFIKVLAKNSFSGFEIMGTYSPTVNYNKKYMLVFEDGSTYIRIADGDCIGLSPKINADKWALFSSGTLSELEDLQNLIQGSETVVVDINEAGTALEVHADYENIVLPIERAIKAPLQFPWYNENIVACLNKNTGQFFPELSKITSPNAVVQRNDFGEIPVPDDPRYDYNAVNKKWVEDKIAQSAGGGVKWYKHYIKTSAVFPQWVCILSTIPPLNPAPERLNEFISGLFRNINNSQNNKNISVFAEAHLLGVLSDNVETSVIGFSVYNGDQYQGFFAITDLYPYSTPTTSSPIYIYSSDDIENKIGFLFDEYYCVEL